MEFGMFAAGLGLTLSGAAVAGFADAWLSRSILIYLDAIEANVEKMAKAIQAGATDLAVTGINLRRDRGQNRARALKTMGWVALVMGFVLQLAAACLTKRPA